MSDRLADFMQEIRDFVLERDWGQFHDPKKLAMLVSSEAGDLLADYRWAPSAETDARASDEAARRRIEAEVADVGIATLLFDRLGLDAIGTMRQKLETN